jgi:phosphoribosylformylglycinamidine synthase
VKFEARVEVSHLPGVLDPQGATVERALPALGYRNVSAIRIGKSIRLVVDAPDEAAARTQVEEMCERLLANPVIEAYAIEIADITEPTERGR